MEDLAVFTALNHSGSFGKNFVKFQKNKYFIYRLRVWSMEANSSISRDIQSPEIIKNKFSLYSIVYEQFIPPSSIFSGQSISRPNKL